ncbi:MAG: HU family DNA-binding protein [Tannerellaceae bacterium]|jgi:predicted histone-like DNA-binding protein|nr:HU family DNA-binding protein [Tannerellaceae bacterium]
MKARYSVFHNPPQQGEEPENTGIHARLVEQNRIGIDLIAKQISQFSSFSAGDVKGLLTAFQEQLALHLSCGDIVELEGLGRFSVSVKNAPATREKEVTPSKVKFGKVVFRCSKELKRQLEGMSFERSGEGSRLKTRPEAKRKARILAYLENHHTILTSTCRTLNNCSKYLALKDLKELQEEGKILLLGPRNIAQYTAVKDK